MSDSFLQDSTLPEPAAPPAFTPTPEQAEALALMQAWLDTPKEDAEPFFTLKGYAGTGKTFCIKQLAASGKFKPHQICFTAPTNKAVKVLRNYLDEAGLSESPTRTIYSLLGLSLQANGEVRELRQPEDPVDLSSLRLVVVDEGSMVNRFLMQAIAAGCESIGLPVLFMGDPAQLPPVGEETSPIWALPQTYQLTKVMRYGGPILDLATRIREQVDRPFPAITIKTEDPVFVVGKEAFHEAILDHLPSIFAGKSKVIAWRNITVQQYNTFVRKELFPKAYQEPWLPTDRIVATAPLKDLEDVTFMRTDEEAEILEVREGKHPLYREIEIYNLLVKLESGRKATIRVTTEAGQFHLSNQLEELAMKAKKGQPRYWREFWGMKEAFHEIKHSYAITTHRSQGSSYTEVFVDRDDIMRNKNRGEAFRSLYVAVTRAREKVYIY